MLLRSLAARLGSGELDPVAYMRDVLDRLAADPFNLVVTLDAERALAEAAHPRPGPLSGVPIGIKDLIDVAGLPTRCGSNKFSATCSSTRASSPMLAAISACASRR